MTDLFWTNSKRKPCDLIPYRKNPRKITNESRNRLRTSLEKFGLADVIILNNDNTIVSGHKRVELLIEMGLGKKNIDVRIPSRQLTELELKEYNIEANIHAGEFDEELLVKYFKDIDLESLGFDLEGIISENKYENSYDDSEEFKEPVIKKPVVQEKKDISNEIKVKYLIEVELFSEREQEFLYNELKKNGHTCRILTL